MKIKALFDVRKPQQKHIVVEMNFSFSAAEIEDQPDGVLLHYPSWVPGSYKYREFAKHVVDFEIVDATGKPVRYQKVSKNQWRVPARAASNFTVKYRVYSNALNVRGCYTDHRMVFTHMAPVFLHAQGFLETPVDVDFKLPKDWKVAFAKTIKGGKVQFKDFHELYDSPILACEQMDTASFKLGQTHVDLMCTGFYKKDIKEMAKDLQPILEKQIQAMGGHPCKRYVFQVMFEKGMYGGLEHMHSSSNVFDGFLLDDPKQYENLLGLLAHEHFHIWNVKRIRPEAFSEYDYGDEVYTEDLWMAEGITRYYDDHSLLRAGFTGVSRYLDVIAEMLTTVQNNKGYAVTSLSQSSFDAWIKFYRPDENAVNRIASYYTKGGLVMLYLDLMMIRDTDGKHSIDDVMKVLYKEYLDNPHKGVSRAHFFEVVERFWKKPTREFVKKYLDGTGKIPLKAVFEDFGVEFKEKQASKTPYLGISPKMEGSKVLIRSIHEDSPAFNSALQPDDEILAINGLRLENLDQASKLLDEKENLILFCRRSKVMSATVSLEMDERKVVNLSWQPHTAKQKKLMQIFLRRQLGKKDKV